MRVPAGLTRSKVGKRIVYQSNPPGLRVKIWTLRDFDEFKLKGRFGDIDREALNFSTKKVNEPANEEVGDGLGHVDEMQVGDSGHAKVAGARARYVEEFSDISNYAEGVSARHAKEVLDGAEKCIEIMEIESISDESDTGFPLSVNSSVTSHLLPSIHGNSSNLPTPLNSSQFTIPGTSRQVLIPENRKISKVR